jgi:hypothetical protein
MQAFTGIEAISMQYKESATINQLMLVLLCHFTQSKFHHQVTNEWMAQQCVVVTDCQSHTGTISSQCDQSSDNVTAG